LEDGDKFEMPVLDLSYDRSLDELIGATITNGVLSGNTIAEIKEGLKLKIDEKGAKVENYGMMVTNESCIIRNEPPKKCILDRPFWIIMRETGKHPYVCVHINNV